MINKIIRLEKNIKDTTEFIKLMKTNKRSKEAIKEVRFLQKKDIKRLEKLKRGN